jgi:hypothetical protein
VKHPLIIADSHGVSFSSIFGDLKDPWDSDGNAPVSITRDGQEVGKYYVLNSKSSFFVKIVSERGSTIDVHPQIKPQILDKLTSFDGCLVSLDGNVHMAHFMCQNGPVFDFHEPNAPSFIPETRQIIPRESLEKFLMLGEELLLGNLTALKQLLGSLPIFFIAPPLPIPSEQQIHGQSEIFNFRVQRIEHPTLRLKIFHAYCRCLENVCRKMGISFVPPNHKAADSEGFLLEEYWLAATHAKPGYYTFLSSL